MQPGRYWPGFFVCGVFVSCVSCAGTVVAQVTAAADYLAQMDTDHDRRVSLREYQDWLSYAFDAMDRDRDGVLSTGELPGGRGPPISREQHRARLADAFHRQDRNGDGLLDARELAAAPR
jgi:EF hand domain-containing protein